MNFIYSNTIFLPDLYSQTSGKLTFTSLLSDEKQFIFLDEHLNRFVRGVAYFENYSDLEREECKQRCKDFLFKNFYPHHYFRLLYAEGTFYFSSSKHQPKKATVKLLFSPKNRELSSKSFIKDGNYRIAFAEMEEATKLGFDDILFGDDKNIFEASTSNILLIKENKIFINKLSENVFDGIFVKKLSNYLEKDFSIIECELSLLQLYEAEEIWLTNCIQGMRFVEHLTIQNWHKDYQLEKSLYEKTQKKLGRFGELINE